MDATFWATVALFIFVAIVLYLKVPGMMAKSLDDRAEKIRAELEDARKLARRGPAVAGRVPAQAQGSGSRKPPTSSRSPSAKPALLAEEAQAKTEEYVARRTALAEQKIGQAEREAINEVRASAVDLAVEAARQLLGSKVDAKASADLFKSSVQEVKAKLN